MVWNYFPPDVTKALLLCHDSEFFSKHMSLMPCGHFFQSYFTTPIADWLKSTRLSLLLRYTWAALHKCPFWQLEQLSSSQSEGFLFIWRWMRRQCVRKLFSSDSVTWEQLNKGEIHYSNKGSVWKQTRNETWESMWVHSKCAKILPLHSKKDDSSKCL